MCSLWGRYDGQSAERNASVDGRRLIRGGPGNFRDRENPRRDRHRWFGVRDKLARRSIVDSATRVPMSAATSGPALASHQAEGVAVPRDDALRLGVVRILPVFVVTHPIASSVPTAKSSISRAPPSSRGDRCAPSGASNAAGVAQPSAPGCSALLGGPCATEGRAWGGDLKPARARQDALPRWPGTGSRCPDRTPVRSRRRTGASAARRQAVWWLGETRAKRFIRRWIVDRSTLKTRATSETFHPCWSSNVLNRMRSGGEGGQVLLL